VSQVVSKHRHILREGECTWYADEKELAK